MACFKDKEQDKFKGPMSAGTENYQTLITLSCSNHCNMLELSQAACLAPFPSYIKKGIQPSGNMQTLPNQQVTHKSLCSLAIKTDKQPMLFIWLPGSQPTVLVVTLFFNNLYLPYILPCVRKFFSNPNSDHDIYFILFVL